MAGAAEEARQTHARVVSQPPTTRGHNQFTILRDEPQGAGSRNEAEEEIGDVIEVARTPTTPVAISAAAPAAPRIKKTSERPCIPTESQKESTVANKTKSKTQNNKDVLYTIRELREEVRENNRELKAENEALRRDNEALWNEVREMRVELKALAKPGPSQAWQGAPSTLRTPFPGI